MRRVEKWRGGGRRAREAGRREDDGMAGRGRRREQAVQMEAMVGVVRICVSS